MDPRVDNFVMTALTGLIRRTDDTALAHSLRVADAAVELYRTTKLYAFWQQEDPLIALQKVRDVWRLGALHDVAEDTDWTVEKIQAETGISDALAEQLRLLTHDPEESYDDYLLRIVQVPLLATIVKLADMRDNANVVGLAKLSDARIVKLVHRYGRWLPRLEEAMHVLV